MICMKAREELRRIERELDKRIEERERKGIEKVKMLKCLKDGVCPKCGTLVSPKIHFFNRIFDSLLDEKIYHYNCPNCGLKGNVGVLRGVEDYVWSGSISRW